LLKNKEDIKSQLIEFTTSSNKFNQFTTLMNIKKCPEISKDFANDGD